MSDKKPCHQDTVPLYSRNIISVYSWWKWFHTVGADKWKHAYVHMHEDATLCQLLTTHYH